MRPIDADALKDAFANLEFHHADRYVKEACDWILEDVVPSEIDEAPTLDVVPVTRCEKCKHAHRTGVKDVYFCDVFECEVTHDFFCKEGAI